MELAAQLVHRFYDEVWNEWNTAAAHEVLHPELTFRGSIGVDQSGIDGFLAYRDRFQRIFPDFICEVTELIEQGDKVAARVTFSGTHSAELFDMAATGRRICYDGAALFTLKDNQLASVWVLGDVPELKRQLQAA